MLLANFWSMGVIMDMTVLGFGGLLVVLVVAVIYVSYCKRR
jgi:hypothetical protein